MPQGGGKGGKGALDQALETFDGEILAEREVIAQRSNERPGGQPSGAGASPEAGAGMPGGAQNGTSASAQAGARTSLPRRAPAMPGTGAGAGKSGRGGNRDARDDDIIARQLREAAMAEQDPVLREKLWEEYRRYKGS